MRTIGGKIGNAEEKELKTLWTELSPTGKNGLLPYSYRKAIRPFFMCHSGQVSDDLLTGQKNFQEISGLISEIVLNGPLIGAGQESTKKKLRDSFPK